VATPPPGTPSGWGASGCGESGWDESGALLIDDPDDPVLGGGLWLCIEGAGAACNGVGVGAGAVTPPTWVCSRS